MEKCISDMHAALARGRISLDEQIRAYDVLDGILESGQASSAERFCEEYGKVRDSLDGIYDEDALVQEAEGILAPLREMMDEARLII